MPEYTYRAKTEEGLDKKGRLTADNESELAHLLREKGLILVSAQREGEGKRRLSLPIPFIGKVSLTDKLMFTRNLKVMVEAGLPLPKALDVLRKQTRSKTLSGVLKKVKEDVVGGRSFSEALSKHPQVFSDLFLSMIEVGEAGGNLEEVLEVLARQMEREHDLKSKILGALIYPAVIILAMMGIGFLMLVMVVPKISTTFEELDVELPATTRFVITLGNLLSTRWYLFLAGLAGAGITMFYFRKTKTAKRIFGWLGLHTPILSSLVKKINSAYTLRSLSSLVSAGVSLPSALEIMAGAASNIYYEETIRGAVGKIRKGEKLSEALGKKKIYPSLVIEMIAVGEETGETGKILDKLAEFFEKQVTRATKNLASVVEPIVMLLIGGAVGFFAISMIQPMYSMLGAIQ